MDSWMLSSPFRLCGALLVLGTAPALAGVAGTGTATVKVDFVAQKLGVNATFGNQPGDLQGVNLGTLAPFMATGVSLTNVDVLTGACTSSARPSCSRPSGSTTSTPASR
jgi:hypothetical protein